MTQTHPQSSAHSIFLSENESLCLARSSLFHTPSPLFATALNAGAGRGEVRSHRAFALPPAPSPSPSLSPLQLLLLCLTARSLSPLQVRARPSPSPTTTPRGRRFPVVARRKLPPACSFINSKFRFWFLEKWKISCSFWQSVSIAQRRWERYACANQGEHGGLQS